jgi:hypothetical protein
MFLISVTTAAAIERERASTFRRNCLRASTKIA